MAARRPKTPEEIALEADIAADRARKEVRGNRGLGALLGSIRKKNRAGEITEQQVAQSVADLVKAVYTDRDYIEEAIKLGALRVERVSEDEGVIIWSDDKAVKGEEVAIHYYRFKNGEDRGKGFPQDAAYRALFCKGEKAIELVYLSGRWRVLDKQDLTKDG